MMRHINLAKEFKLGLVGEAEGFAPDPPYDVIPDLKEPVACSGGTGWRAEAAGAGPPGAALLVRDPGGPGFLLYFRLSSVVKEIGNSDLPSIPLLESQSMVGRQDWGDPAMTLSGAEAKKKKQKARNEDTISFSLI